MLSKKIFISFIQIFICVIAFSQNADKNLQKYWYYRYRLLNDFILVGDCQGCSIPAERRGPEQATETTGHTLDFWADETANLGMYLAVLGTEYKLLKDNNQNTTQTSAEIYYALKAIDRLDLNAEYYWRLPPGADYSLPPQPENGDLNGFFIRSDIKKDFIDLNFQHFNSGKASSSFTVTQSHSSMNDNDDLLNEAPKPESMDQVMNLMMGLAFVSEYETDIYNGMNLAQEARDITDRMVMWIKSGGTNIWKIHNAGNGAAIDNRHGGDAYILSYGFAEAACHIVKQPAGILNTVIPFSCAKYHDGMTIADYEVFQNFWKNLLYCPTDVSVGILYPNFSTYTFNIYDTGFPCTQCQEVYKPELLAALGDCYYKCLGLACVPGVNLTGTYLSIQANSTHMEIMPLIHQALYKGINTIKKSTYTKMLDDAPCGGPYNLGDCHYATYEWSAPVRWRQPERRGAGCPDQQSSDACNAKWYGEYNGLDYMLLFNLYSIVTKNYVNSYVNHLDKFIASDFPLLPPIGTVGSMVKPLLIKAFSTIKMSSVVHNSTTDLLKRTGDVTLRAGEEIALLPGFGVEAGANFGAFVEPLKCDNNGDYRSSESTANQREEYIGPTSFVYHSDGGQILPDIPDAFGESPTADLIMPSLPNFLISPNPTSNGLFTILFPEAGKGANISIYNCTGDMVYQSKTSHQSIEVNLSAHPKGIYFIKGQSGEMLYTDRLIIQ